nr:thiamine-phosphate kinase [Nocardioidaceae bacterium]
MTETEHPEHPEPSVGAWGERRLVEALTAGLPQGQDVLVGPGDDAALVVVGGGRSGREVLVSTDVAVEGRHFRRDWSSAADIGHRVSAANLSDIAAMGGIATCLVVALAAPGDLPSRWALDLA